MSYDKKYFESVISKIFDDEIKKVLSSDELEKFQKINNNTYYIKSFNKSLFETDQESFLENSKLKNSTIRLVQFYVVGAVQLLKRVGMQVLTHRHIVNKRVWTQKFI